MNEDINNIDIVQYVNAVKNNLSKAKPVVIGGTEKIYVDFEEYKFMIRLFDIAVQGCMSMTTAIECCKGILDGKANIKMNEEGHYEAII